MAGKLMTGSICLSDLNEQAKKAHSAFSRSDKNQKIYVNVKVWINDEADNYGNHASVQLNPKKDMETENIYIGHLKNVERKEAEPLKQDEVAKEIPIDDDLPF
jgi:hypothetical protein